MKQIKLIIAAFAIVLATGLSANAQKVGYVNAEALLYSLPEIQGVQQKLQKFQQDSIGGEYERMFAEYKRKDSIVNAASTPKPVKDAATKDRDDLASALQGWQNYATQWGQAKQAELLAPLNKKVMDAINAVAKEKGYTYILHPDALIVAPPGDDITEAAATKLGIKIPKPGTAPAAATPAKK